MKKKKILQRAVTYYRSHMWCSLLVSIFGMIFIIALILLGYMKSKYYQYLLDTTYESEKVMIESVKKNIENQMESFIDLGQILQWRTGLYRKLKTMYRQERPISMLLS